MQRQMQLQLSFTVYMILEKMLCYVLKVTQENVLLHFEGYTFGALHNKQVILNLPCWLNREIAWVIAPVWFLDVCSYFASLYIQGNQMFCSAGGFFNLITIKAERWVSLNLPYCQASAEVDGFKGEIHTNISQYFCDK